MVEKKIELWLGLIFIVSDFIMNIDIQLAEFLKAPLEEVFIYD